MTQQHNISTATVGDRLHAIARAGLGSIPVLGAAATELFAAVIAPPLEKRRIEWMNDVAEQLQQLEERGHLKFDELQENELFLTAVMHAGQAAVRNHQTEKREALRNAVLNAALPNSPDESLQHHFINQVDTFTIWHIRLLDLFHSPIEWFQKHGAAPPVFGISSTFERLITSAWPELQSRYEFLKVIVEELNTKGLINGGDLRVMRTASGAYEKQTTTMGDQLLAFIKLPKA